MTINLDVTTTIALWGAFTGTAAIVWDFVKWKTDAPRLKVSVNPNMQMLDQATGRLDPKQLIQVHVVNVGKRPTKITALLGWPFKTRMHRLFGKPTGDGFVSMEPLTQTPLPLVLQPGDDWSGFLHREAALKIVGDATLYCGVQHTLAKKPALARIDPKTLRPPKGAKDE